MIVSIFLLFKFDGEQCALRFFNALRLLESALLAKSSGWPATNEHRELSINFFTIKHTPLTVGKNARTSKTKMYKQKSYELSIITVTFMHKAEKIDIFFIFERELSLLSRAPSRE